MTETSLSTIKSIALFKNCDDAFIESLHQNAAVQKLSKGQVVFINHDPAERFYVVLSGWVKLFRETLDGAQAVVDILPASHMFGETSIFENDTYPYSAEAAEPARVLSMPLSLLKTEIKTNSKLALDMLSSMAHYRKQQAQEIEHLSLQNAAQRIGCFLLRLADQDANGPVQIHLPYDKTLVAARLGMQPETFSRALAKLKTATSIDVQGATISLESLNQLVNYSCTACSSEFPCKDLVRNN